MKSVRMLPVLFVVVLALTAVASAQKSPSKFLYTVRTTIQPHGVDQYEDFARKVMEAAKKTEAAQQIMGTQVVHGSEGTGYLFALPFNKWEEMDAWPSVQEMLVKAFGEDEAAKILRSGRSVITHSETRVTRLQENLITNASEAPSAPPKMWAVTITEVHPEKVLDYLRLIGKYKKAEEEDAGTGYAVRRVSVQGPAFVMSTARPINSFADVDKRPSGLMVKAYGEEDARQINMGILSCIKSRESFTIAVRPDLSYQPGQEPTTNE